MIAMALSDNRFIYLLPSYLLAPQVITPVCGLRWFRWYFMIGLHKVGGESLSKTFSGAPTTRHSFWDYPGDCLPSRPYNGKAPSYIRDMLHLTKPVRVLRSQCAPTLERPCTRRLCVNYGDRAFSATAPALWNGLPAHIRCAKTLDNFKKLLKTYFFRQAFNESCAMWSTLGQDVILDLALYKFGISF